MDNNVVTRFAPSPTGFLHIGGARTALFNWLYAKKTNGKFLLRIEDTDPSRSSSEATQAIFKGLKWLNLEWDGNAISQKRNIERHQEIAHELIRRDAAYRCYATQEEIAEYQSSAKQEGTSTVFRSPWRDGNVTLNKRKSSVIRLRSPNLGTTQILDKIKGSIKWKNDTLDDLILLRADGTPTYMLAVVVDDHDMLVSHIIRGEDHLTNTARQLLIYNSMEWKVPEFAHIPLIHGTDGVKLSKRHGAVGVSEYEKMGYPSIAFKNYLARLGWSHGNEEYFTTKEAIEWFSLKKIGKSPSRFDKKKLDSVSKYHLNQMDPSTLTKSVIAFTSDPELKLLIKANITKFKENIEILRDRSKNYQEIIDNSSFLLVKRPIKIQECDHNLLDSKSLKMLERLTLELTNVSWSNHNIEVLLASFVEKEGVKFKAVAEPLRLALLGERSSPSIAKVIEILGKKETLNRISDVL